MEIADVWLKIDDKNNIPVRRVTPPELQYLVNGRIAIAKGNPLDYIKVIGTVTRTTLTEIGRLRKKYGTRHDKATNQYVARINDLFPGTNPNIPQRFSDLVLETQEASVPLTANSDQPGPKHAKLLDEVVPVDFDLNDDDKIQVPAQRVTEKDEKGNDVTKWEITLADGSKEIISDRLFKAEYKALPQEVPLEA